MEVESERAQVDVEHVQAAGHAQVARRRAAELLAPGARVDDRDLPEPRRGHGGRDLRDQRVRRRLVDRERARRVGAEGEAERGHDERLAAAASRSGTRPAGGA